MTLVRVAAVRYPVTVLGPGRRVGVWLQGCSIGCAGCMSRDTWDLDGGTELEVSDLVERVVVTVGDGPLDGVTISGGEPFEQPAALGELVEGLRTRLVGGSSGVDLACYSGYGRQRLEREHHDLLAALDVVIAGPYVRTHATSVPWVGSGNQEVVVRSELGRRWTSRTLEDEGQRLQVEVGDGRFTVIGTPRAGDLERVAERLAEVGISLTGATWRS